MQLVKSVNRVRLWCLIFDPLVPIYYTCTITRTEKHRKCVIKHREKNLNSQYYTSTCVTKQLVRTQVHSNKPKNCRPEPLHILLHFHRFILSIWDYQCLCAFQVKITKKSMYKGVKEAWEWKTEGPHRFRQRKG